MQTLIALISPLGLVVPIWVIVGPLGSGTKVDNTMINPDLDGAFVLALFLGFGV